MSTPVPPVQGAVAGEGTRTAERGAPRQDKPAPRAVVGSEIDREKVLDALEREGNRIDFGTRSAEFRYDRDLDLVIVKVYTSDTEPREVVRQIPPESYVAFASKFRELLGVLFDEQF